MLKASGWEKSDVSVGLCVLKGTDGRTGAGELSCIAARLLGNLPGTMLIGYSCLTGYDEELLAIGLFQVPGRFQVPGGIPIENASRTLAVRLGLELELLDDEVLRLLVRCLVQSLLRCLLLDRCRPDRCT